jgi:hypothetical protein
MAGRGDKIWHHDTEVKPNYEKLDDIRGILRHIEIPAFITHCRQHLQSSFSAELSSRL